MILKFRAQLKKEGRSLVWFHKNYIGNITYAYFIIQINKPALMHPEVYRAMADYLED